MASFFAGNSVAVWNFALGTTTDLAHQTYNFDLESRRSRRVHPFQGHCNGTVGAVAEPCILTGESPWQENHLYDVSAYITAVTEADPQTIYVEIVENKVNEGGSKEFIKDWDGHRDIPRAKKKGISDFTVKLHTGSARKGQHSVD